MEGGTEAVLGVILTVVTAGAGGAAAAGAAGSRLATVAAKLSPLIQKLSNAIKKRKWFKKRVTVKSNVREEVTTVHKPKRKPIQPDKKKWKENGGTVKKNPDGSTTYTNKDGISVTYNQDGYPDFSPHSPKKPVRIEGMKGDHYYDYKAANAAIGRTGVKPPKGYTWHHMEDGEHMQLVPKDIHRDFPHTGGASKVKNGEQE